MDSDLVEIFSHLAASLRDVLSCSGVAILSTAEGSADVVVQHGPQPLPHEIRLTVSQQELLDRLAREGRALLETFEDAPPLPSPAVGATWIGVPIMVSGRLRGCVSMTGQFEPGAELQAFQLTRQASVALGWAERARAAEQKVVYARRLIEVEQQLRKVSDYGPALELVLDEAITFTGASHGCVLIIRHGRAVALGRRGYSQEEVALLQQIPPSLERGLTGRAYKTGAPTRSDDVANDPTALPMLASSRAQIVVPIRLNTQVFGLIDLQSPEPYAFASADVAWLLDLGGLAAPVIERMVAQPVAQPGEGAPQHDLMLSSRLAVVTDLAAGVAHEINNPLTTILGYTHLLLRDQTLPQATRDDIGQIMVEGRRIAVLVERFLSFAQPTSSGKRPLPIDEPLREALGLLRSRFQESGVHVEVDIPADPPMIVGQAGQLEQAFLDLLHNAVEAMHTSEVRRITIQVSEQGGQARVAISDSGRGIRPDLLSRVFEPGFTTKVDKGISRGLGLGLYATHSIIEDHWGRIEVYSQLRRGSTFTVCLPVL